MSTCLSKECNDLPRAATEGSRVRCLPRLIITIRAAENPKAKKQAMLCVKDHLESRAACMHGRGAKFHVPASWAVGQYVPIPDVARTSAVEKGESELIPRVQERMEGDGRSSQESPSPSLERSFVVLNGNRSISLHPICVPYACRET